MALETYISSQQPPSDFVGSESDSGPGRSSRSGGVATSDSIVDADRLSSGRGEGPPAWLIDGAGRSGGVATSDDVEQDGNDDDDTPWVDRVAASRRKRNSGRRIL